MAQLQGRRQQTAGVGVSAEPVGLGASCGSGLAPFQDGCGFDVECGPTPIECEDPLECENGGCCLPSGEGTCNNDNDCCEGNACDGGTCKCCPSLTFAHRPHTGFIAYGLPAVNSTHAVCSTCTDLRSFLWRA